MNYILIPGRNRPEFFYLTLESLVKNPEIKDYRLLFALENDVDEHYFEIIRSFTNGLEPEIVKWSKMYGLTKGILEGFKAAFSKADEYVILLEDDVVVSKDFLKFLDYCYRHFYSPGGDIATIGSFYRSLGRVDYVYKERCYLPWGLLLPKDLFDQFLLEHCNESYYQNSKQYADRYFLRDSPRSEVEQAELALRIVIKNSLYQILPEVPRSLEIGFYGKHKHYKVEDYDQKSLQEKIAYTRELLAMKGMGDILNNDYTWDELKLLSKPGRRGYPEWHPYP